jgi:hypothetical protein
MAFAVSSLNGFVPIYPAEPFKYGLSLGGQLNHAEPVTHASSRDHAPRQIGRLLDIVLSSRCFDPVDNFIGSSPSQHTDDPSAKIEFGIVIPIALGPLIGDAKGLSTWDDRDPVHWVSACYDETQDGVAALMIGDSFTVSLA